MRYCPYCMKEIKGTWCPHCQKDTADASNGTNLAIGTILNTHYVIGRCLGAGGFGVTYLAKDLNLGLTVAIKEYFPSCWAYRRKNTQEVCALPDQKWAYEHGKEEFLREGQRLAKLEDLPHIVDIYGFFEENGTSYLVMRYLEGKTLEELVRSSEKGRLELNDLLPLLLPLMENIDRMHRKFEQDDQPPLVEDPDQMQKKWMLHRDITPGNIMFSRGKLWLIDFGSARQVMGDKSVSALVSLGFAPVEQFSRKNQGPYTDVYAMAATIYYCITGKKPQDAASRAVDDQLLFPGELPDDVDPHITKEQSDALRHAMAIQYGQRTPTMAAFIKELTQEPEEAPKRVEKPRKAPKRAKHPFLRRKLQLPQLHIQGVLQYIVCKKWVLLAVVAAILLAILFAKCKSETPPQAETPGETPAADVHDEQPTNDPTDGPSEPENDEPQSDGQLSEEPPESTPTLSLRLENCKIVEGQSVQLEPALTPEDYQSTASTWESSDSSIAEVSESGEVKAKKPGMTTITLTVDGVKAVCTVTVLEAQMESVTVQAGPDKTEDYASMPFDPTGITLKVTYNNGETEEVIADFECTGFDSSTPGEKAVTISYEDMQAGKVYVTVKPKVLIQDAGTAGFQGYNLVDTVQYNNKVYYTKMTMQSSDWSYSICRKDTPSAEPVCVYTAREGFVGEFFLLRDRIFFATSTGGDRIIATVDLNGENYYAITARSKDCIGCYYSNGWIYSYSAGDGRLVRFRTDGSQYEWVGEKEIPSGKYSISGQKILYTVYASGGTVLKCFDIEKKTTTTLKTLNTESVRLIGAYGDALFYNMYDAVKKDNVVTGGEMKMYLYDLKNGTTYTLGSGKTEAAIWNGKIFTCDEDGNAELRELRDPAVVTKTFKLPYALMSGVNVQANLVIPVGNNLGFITDGTAGDSSMAKVILINSEFDEVAVITVEQG